MPAVNVADVLSLPAVVPNPGHNERPVRSVTTAQGDTLAIEIFGGDQPAATQGWTRHAAARVRRLTTTDRPIAPCDPAGDRRRRSRRREALRPT